VIEMKRAIENYIRAAYPVLAVNTREEIKSLRMFKQIAEELDREIYVWSITRGIIDTRNNKIIDSTDDPVKVIEFCCSKEKSTIIVMLDVNPYMEDPVFLRSIRDNHNRFKSGITLILIGVNVKIPEDIGMITTRVESRIPSKEELRDSMEQIASQNQIEFSPVDLDESCEAAAGLTIDEAINAFSLSIIENKGKICAKTIMREKCNQIGKREYLQVIEKVPSIEEIGGLDILIDWIKSRKKMYSNEAKDFGLPIPKGLLMIGLPGGGKSLSAKAIPSVLGIPLVRFDFGAVMGSLVGESESNMRDAIATAEAMAPCVLWVDELDKQLSTGSGGEGHEVTKRMLASLLTWLQEKESPVFVVATANNIQNLANSHPELLRKGRWDEVFFIDLPNKKEREKIFQIHIQKMGRSPQSYLYGKFAEATEGFVGAEIEAAVKDAMFISFNQKEELSNESILEAISRIVPQSKMVRESINGLREWAKDRARLASVAEDKEYATKLDIS